MPHPCPTPKKFNLAATLVITAVGLSTVVGGFPEGVAEAVGPAPHAAAPQLQPQVVTSSYALAQLTSYIGGKAVHVVNLAPPGVQPEGLRLTPSGREAVERAALVVDVGDGYQPQVEAAAKAARRHLSVLPQLSKRPGPSSFGWIPTSWPRPLFS